MKNRSNRQDYTVNVVLRVDTVLYTGKLKDPVRKETADCKVKAGAGKKNWINYVTIYVPNYKDI